MCSIHIIGNINYINTRIKIIHIKNINNNWIAQQAIILREKNPLKIKKLNFINFNLNKKIILKQKNIKITQNTKKILNNLLFYFNKYYFQMNQKHNTKYLFFLFKNFFLTHDLNFFSKKLIFILYKSSKQELLKLIRNLIILNNKNYKIIFNYFKISGMYIKISGKFNGFGGAKKLKKHIILHKIKFNDKNIKIKRSLTNVRHKVGLTTWSIFASFLNV